MTKLIVNNRTDALKTDINLFQTITNCQIVKLSALVLDALHEFDKFMCLSTYWQLKLANERAKISAVIVKLHIKVTFIKGSSQGVHVWVRVSDWWKLEYSGAYIHHELMKCSIKVQYRYTIDIYWGLSDMNLLAFYHEYRSLIGYSTNYLFCCSITQLVV